MRPMIALPLAALVLLSACATPREACISEASADLRRVNAFITDTQANIARGYALETRQEVRVREALCYGLDSEGNPFSFECEKTEVIDVQVPVAINLAAEREKLDSLIAQQAVLERQSQARIQACIAAYPDEG